MGEVKPLSAKQAFTWESTITELLLIEIRDLLKEIREKLQPPPSTGGDFS